MTKLKLALIPDVMYFLTIEACNQCWIANKLRGNTKAECEFYKPGKNNLGKIVSKLNNGYRITTMSQFRALNNS